MQGLFWFVGKGLKWVLMLTFIRGVFALSGDARRARSSKDKKADENPD
jgi:hypothetical protein